MRNHKDLIVWQKSMEHVLTIYEATKLFPKEETFGIINQMRRSAISIPSNIAEGYGRVYGKETAKFLSKLLKNFKPECELIISKNLGYATPDKIQELIKQNEEIIKMLSSLIKSLCN